MEQYKLDEFFKEKSDGFELTPSSMAWDQIESELAHAKTQSHRWIYKVAAALVVGFGVGVTVFLNQQEVSNKTPLLSSIDSPVPASSIPKIEITETEIEETIIPNVPSSVEKPLIAIDENAPAILPQYEVLELVAINDINTAIDAPVMATPSFDPILKMNEPSVSIKYFASATPEGSSASKKKLGKIWNYAISSSPADIMADIRDAKDNLFKSGESLD